MANSLLKWFAACLLISCLNSVFTVRAVDLGAGPGDSEQQFEPALELASKAEFWSALACQEDGKLVLAGTGVLRWNCNGTLDTSFAVTNLPLARVEKVLPNDGGKLVLLGYPPAATNRTLVRLHADGSSDNQFQPEIKVDEDVGAAAIYSHGTVIVSLGNANSQLKRPRSDGRRLDHCRLDSGRWHLDDYR